jgi:translation elongation factor EF-Tu-like GTPase
MAGFAEVLIELLPTEQGGRRTPVWLSTDNTAPYRPHFRVRGGNGEMLGVEFVDGPDEPVAPGGRTYATVRFVCEPQVCYDELVLGAEFEMLEGGRAVGVGRVTRT